MVELGQRLQFDNRYEEAEALYRQAIEVNPQNIQAYESLALVFQNQGRHDEAEAIYRQAIETYPTIDSYKKLGMLLERHERYEEAERVYRQLVDYFIQNYEYYTEIEGIVQTRILVHHSYYMLGSFFERYECYKEAEEAYRELIYYFPDDAGAYLLLGDVLGLQGRNAEAQAAYRQAAEIDPSLL